MPLYHFDCLTCKKQVRQICTPAEAKAGVLCRDCKQPLKRTPKAPSVSVVERLDNGHMARAIERPADAERLYKERAAKSTEDAKNNT